ncbi:MAG TPA: CpsB/CapC family capsule biosynthesis tyrosine phosphatase [Bacteroidales bacterium]|nr:CpsB/CapC family capsule biosynthesis tyrosine phosphatase [Bacteroidales bacterium]
MSFFNKLFSKTPTVATGFSAVGTDFHSHLIPGIDDGVKSIEESLELIRQFKELGFKKLITTPHAQEEFFKNDTTTIISGLKTIKDAVRNEGIEIEIEAAAEYLLDDGFAKKFRNGELITFGNKYLLVELNYYSPHPNFKQFLFDLQIEGYQVILAHPERYSYWFRDFGKYNDLKDRAIFFQINTVSLAGHYGNEEKKVAEKLIKEGMVEFVGSDVHNQHYMNSLIKAGSEKILRELIESGKLLNHTL